MEAMQLFVHYGTHREELPPTLCRVAPCAPQRRFGGESSRWHDIQSAQNSHLVSVACAVGLGVSAAALAGLRRKHDWRGSRRLPQGVWVASSIVDTQSVATQERQKPRVPSWKRRKNKQLYQELDEGQPELVPSKRPSSSLRKPEVMAPAGGWPQLRAAVRNGADAVYFGINLGLNARARAANFDCEDLPNVMKYLHERGVKAYVTVNTVVFDDELFGPTGEGGMALKILSHLEASAVDAVIIQDVGLALICKDLFPGLTVHASTQMSITSASGARFAHETLGTPRVVVGRELSISELSAVVRETPGAEVEAFVHGALCVSYSGQCFSSEAWGGRSANRGQCAQACRMQYGLVKDGDLIDLGDAERYLLSPQDFMGLERVPDMIEAGISCFKIEGRLKGEEYVAMTTAAYRDAVDRAWVDILEKRGESAEVGGLPAGFVGGAARVVRNEQRKRVALAQVFARGQDADHDGLSHGFLDGPRHQETVRGRAPKHRGVFVGTVSSVGRNARVKIQLSPAAITMPLQQGAGLVFDRDGVAQENQAGGFVDSVYGPDGNKISSSGGLVAGDEVEIAFAVKRDSKGTAALERLRRSVRVGDLVWRNTDPLFNKKLHTLRVCGLPGMEVFVAVSGGPGEPLTVRLVDSCGRVGVGQSDERLSPAKRFDLNPVDLDQALKLKAGGPPNDDGDAESGFWRYGAGEDRGAGIDMTDLQPGQFMPKSQVQRAKQRAIRELMEQRKVGTTEMNSDAWYANLVEGVCSLANPPLARPSEWLLASLSAAAAEAGGLDAPSASSTGVPKIVVLCRTQAQAEAAIALGPDVVYEIQLDFMEAQGLEEAVKSARAAGRRVTVCLPRVLKPGEDRIWQFYLRLGADALLVRSNGALHQLVGLEGAAESPASRRPALIGDFSLNAANCVSASFYLGMRGVERLTPSHDLNVEQICALARGLGPERAARLEIVAHQHMPIFHTEHCVFARFLSTGNSFADCGHPCERTRMHLRDASGKDHCVHADMGCRNTVFNAESQSAARDIDALRDAGIGFLRVELVDEPADTVAPLLQHYVAVARGDLDPNELWELVKHMPDSNGRPQGVGRGSLDASAWRERAISELRPTVATSGSFAAAAAAVKRH